MKWLHAGTPQESETAAAASLAASLCRLTGLLGPYLTIALLLPGGSVIALLLWLHRRIHRSADHAPVALKLARAAHDTSNPVGTDAA